jgi:hypothetical protein
MRFSFMSGMAFRIATLKKLVCTAFIHNDLIRKAIIVNSLFEKGCCILFITTLRQHEIKRITVTRSSLPITLATEPEIVRAENLFFTLEPGEHRDLQQARKMTGVMVYLSRLRLVDGELLIIASSDNSRQAPDSSSSPRPDPTRGRNIGSK